MYLVVVVSLFLREDIDENGNLKEGAQQHTAGGSQTTATDKKEDNEHDHDEEAAMNQARNQFGTPHNETNDDDVD